MNNKPHKFFEIFLENNLSKLSNTLLEIHTAMLDQNIFRVDQNILEKYQKQQSGAATQLGDFYNIFSFGIPEINSLYRGLSKLTKEACEYYEIDYVEQDYVIHGWFNLDLSNEDNKRAISPLYNPKHFHDHSDGFGAPWFHGYYCVNAEPSSTYYKIGGHDGELFENINKNNRAIISETGHPHGRDDWYDKDPRITIAYDISPAKHVAGMPPKKQ